MSCATGGPGLRCTGTPTPAFAGHHDPGDIAFRTTRPNVGCPWLETNDGGVYRTVDCGATWSPAFVGFGALQIYDLAGRPPKSHGSLSRDNGQRALGFSQRRRHLAEPCQQRRLLSRGRHRNAHRRSNGRRPTVCLLAAVSSVSNVLREWKQWREPLRGREQRALRVDPPSGRGVAYALAPEKFVEVAGSVVYVGISGSWPVSAPLPSGLSLSTEGFVGGGTAYFVSSLPGGAASLARVSGLLGPTPAVTATNVGPGNLDFWTPDDAPWIQPHILGVDPSNPMHLIAPDRATRTMRVSTNGGASWQADATLTRLVTDNGRLSFDNPFVNSQVHVIAFDPTNAGRSSLGPRRAASLPRATVARHGFASHTQANSSDLRLLLRRARRLRVCLHLRARSLEIESGKLEPPGCARLRARIARAKAEIADLQDDLRHAAPGEKPAIVRQIRAWQAKLKAARQEAKALGCRA